MHLHSDLDRLQCIRAPGAEPKKYLLTIPGIFSLVFLISPFIATYGFTFVVYGPLFLSLYLVLVFVNSSVKLSLALLSLAILATASASAFYHADYRFLWNAGNIIIALLVFSQVDRAVFEKIVRFSTLLLFILLIGAWITFFHVWTAGLPTAVYVSAEGRAIQQGLFSLGYPTGAGDLNIFRAASIYDEPGTFSFVICCIAGLRHILRKNRAITWFILILGLVTFSLAHVIYMVFHFLSERQLRVKLAVSSMLLLIMISVYSMNQDVFIAIQLLLERFQFSGANDRLVVGDNRSAFILVSFRQLVEADFLGLLFGLREALGCCNPLFPLAERGILGSWPYYFIVGFLILVGVLKKNWIFFAIALLFLQRPSIQSTGYSFLAAALIFSAFLDSQNTKLTAAKS